MNPVGPDAEERNSMSGVATHLDEVVMGPGQEGLKLHEHGGEEGNFRQVALSIDNPFIWAQNREDYGGRNLVSDKYFL